MLALIPFVRKFFTQFIIALVLTTVLSGAGIVVVNRMIDSRFRNLVRAQVKVADDTGNSQPANFLLIGSDSRGFVDNPDDRNKFGSGDEESGQRSDTMMIIHVDPKLKKTIVMAIPRDAYVNIPGIGKRKINAAYNKDLGGGRDKLVETINSNFDVPIHHLVELDFASFREIVNALGTVNIFFPAPARDANSELDTAGKSGCLALNGEQALNYVRSRYYEQLIDGKWQIDGTSNYGRIARQQEFMRRVASLAVRKSLTDPLKGRKVVDAVLKKLVVDQNLKKDDIFKLMNAFKNVDPNDPTHVQFEMLPVKSSRVGSQSVDIVQTAEAEPMLEQLRDLNNSDESASTTTAPRPSAVKLRVLNGSGRKGLAATTIAAFQDFGFQPAGTGNTTSRKVTEIHYPASSKAKAMLVAQYVNGTLVEDNSVADADVELVLGIKFTSIAKPSTSSDSPTTTTTTLPGKTARNGVTDSPGCPA